ncbi:MAG TPA: hypothetical protein VOA87_17445, partial [Thermoanaerobaculia bacterium]|nr:hypothetical protein [Thermoanaerobaculia bacterium]
AAPIAPAEVTAVRGISPHRPRGPFIAAAVGGIAVVVLLAVIAAGLALRARRAPAPPSPPPAAAGGERPSAPVPQAPPTAPPPAPLPTQPTQSTEPLLPAGDTRREGELRAALSSGESARLRAAVGAFRPDERAVLPAAARRDLDRGTRALAAADLLDKAEKAGRPGEALHQAGALLALLPRSARAKGARDSAAAALETAADAAAETGKLDEALQTLASLRAAWPERPGLAERTARAESARKEDQRLESVLAEAARDGQANRPVAGLDLLAGAHPNRRFEPRFKQAQASLEALLAKLDKNPPTVAIRGQFAREYEKDKSIKVPLQVADDLEVAKVELWVRPEGGMFIPIPVNHLSGADYEAEIPPGVHLNKNVEFYVTATDRSGHQGQLGTPANPQRLKRKSWLKNLLGKGEG